MRHFSVQSLSINPCSQLTAGVLILYLYKRKSQHGSVLIPKLVGEFKQALMLHVGKPSALFKPPQSLIQCDEGCTQERHLDHLLTSNIGARFYLFTFFVHSPQDSPIVDCIVGRIGGLHNLLLWLYFTTKCQDAKWGISPCQRLQCPPRLPNF